MQCPICLGDEDYHVRDTDCCWHAFHLPCLLRWTPPTCPMCRAPMEVEPECVIRRVTELVPRFKRLRFALMRALYASKRGERVPKRLVRRLRAFSARLPEPMRCDVAEILDDV